MFKIYNLRFESENMVKYARMRCYRTEILIFSLLWFLNRQLLSVHECSDSVEPFVQVHSAQMFRCEVLTEQCNIVCTGRT